jgi:transposase, IS5 family
MPAIPEQTSGRNLPTARYPGASRSSAASSRHCPSGYGIIKALPKRLRDLAEPVERALSQVRAWVEHPFHIVKNRFGHKKLRYRGLAKNTAQLHTLFALANLVIVKKTLLAQARA